MKKLETSLDFPKALESILSSQCLRFPSTHFIQFLPKYFCLSGLYWPRHISFINFPGNFAVFFFIKDSENEVFIMSDRDNGRRIMQFPEIGRTFTFRIAVRFHQHFKKPILTYYVILYFFQVFICFRMWPSWFQPAVVFKRTDAAWTYTLITVSKNFSKRQALKHSTVL